MKKINKINIFVFVFLIFTVFNPILQMLNKVEWSDFSNIISSSSFETALINSTIVTSVSTLISILNLLLFH